jgi:glutathione S-transferase
MDSLKIVNHLEQLYPQKPLGLACDPYLEEVLELTDKTIKTIMPDFASKVATKILDEASLEFFQRTRKARFGGRTLDEVSAELGGRQAYGKAAPLVERITELLNRDSAGPYFQGSTVSYADFVWTALLAFLEMLSDGSLELLTSANKSSHLALLEACRPWLGRDGH